MGVVLLGSEKCEKTYMVLITDSPVRTHAQIGVWAPFSTPGGLTGPSAPPTVSTRPVGFFDRNRDPELAVLLYYLSLRRWNPPLSFSLSLSLSLSLSPSPARALRPQGWSRLGFNVFSEVCYLRSTKNLEPPRLGLWAQSRGVRGHACRVWCQKNKISRNGNRIPDGQNFCTSLWNRRLFARHDRV